MSSHTNHRRGHGRIAHGCRKAACMVCHPDKVMGLPALVERRARITEREQRADTAEHA